MEYLLVFLLFLIAFLYSSVGHGGASGYLAILALFGIAPALMKPAALTLNIFVSIISFFFYARAGYFRLRLILPFLVASVPMAYLGSRISVKPQVYELILGLFLIIAVGRILFFKGAITSHSSDPRLLPAIMIGALLGFFSGMIGIGGGIILSPVLLLAHWANLKEAATASALFIFFNSISGLAAMLFNESTFDSVIVWWIIAGVLGGVAGSYTGSTRLRQNSLKYLLASILLIAGLKLLIF